ncbi:hypothetical protein Tco_1019596 [Tanacetum coccineum]|uniref:Uncharacterized protein n=1 Tax=Tanacetum coccineum TaxID=301880 RepID=A0ABQ5FXJ5_9ASTR
MPRGIPPTAMLAVDVAATLTGGTHLLTYSHVDSEDSTAPPSPDYVTGPKYPPPPDFVPKPVYPDFMPPEDEVLPAEEQPLPAALSPTADLPGYVPESDPESDPEEDDNEDPKEDPADYLADEGDDGDDEDESSDNDEDDVNIEGDEEEEEHPAPVDSTTVALPTVDQAPSAKETEPFEIDKSAATPLPHLAYRVTARISIRDKPPTPFWSDTEVARLLAIPTPPPSPLSPWSSPLPQIHSPPLPLILSPLPVSPPLHVSSLPPASPIRQSDAPLLGTPQLLPIPLPTSSPPLHLLSTDRRVDKLEVSLPPRKRLGIALCPRYEVGESSSAPTTKPLGGFRADYGFVATMDREIMRDLERDVGYGITDTWDEMLVDMPGEPATDDKELGQGMTEFTTRVRQDRYKIYTRLDDEQTERQLMAGRLNMLYRDTRAHAGTARLIEAEARMS